MTALPLLLSLFLAPAALLDPALDPPDAPFEYFRATTPRLLPFEASPPQDALRLDAGFRVTEAGALACGRGQLAVYLGDPPRPLTVRTKTLLQGWLPVALYHDAEAGVQVLAQAYATRVPGVVGEAGMLRLTLVGGDVAAVVPITVGYVADSGYPVPWPELEPTTSYSVDEDHALRDGRVIYTFPPLAEAERLAALDVPYTQPFTARDVAQLRTTPVCAVRYRLAVGPRQRRSLVFRFPARALTWPLALPPLRGLDFDQTLLRLTEEWGVWSASQPLVTVPEPKLDGAYRAALVRLWAYAGRTELPDPSLEPADRERLLAAPPVRGLVPVAGEPGEALLSPWLTAQRARLHLAADEPEAALAMLYALLVHSSADHSFASAIAAPLEARTGQTTLALGADPAEASAFARLVRDCLVRVQGDELRLLSAVPPAWLVEGAEVQARGIPTPFGSVSTAFSVQGEQIDIALPQGLAPQPQAVRVRVPWYAEAQTIQIDGRPATAEAGWIPVPAGAQRLTLRFDPARLPAGPSYSTALAALRAAYAARVSELASTGAALTRLEPAPLVPLEQRRAAFDERFPPE